MDYAAPEQAAGSGTGSASDVYSAGVMLYEMLSGKLPHEGETAPFENLTASPEQSSKGAMSLLRKIANEPPEPLSRLRPDLPPGLLEAVECMLMKDPARRPRALEARSLLLDALPREPADTGPDSLARPGGLGPTTLGLET